MRPLTEREQEVLTAVIEAHTETAEPVGSRTISRQYLSQLSPATIRNVMYDLEELGLLVQPHTSAGREPTVAGYRLYLNELMHAPRLVRLDRDRLNVLLEDRPATRDEDTILVHVARALANISHLISVAFLPSFDRGVLERIELVPVSDNRVLAVLQIEGGPVDTVMIELGEPMNRNLIPETSRALNERLSGVAIGQLRETIGERLKGLSFGDREVINAFVRDGRAIFNVDARASVVLEGRPNILSQPEFSDRDRLSDLMSVLDDRPSIQELRGGDRQQVEVTVGPENRLTALASCSLLARSYQVGSLSGTLAIVGPMRMPYPRLVAALEHAGLITEELLS